MLFNKIPNTAIPPNVVQLLKNGIIPLFGGWYINVTITKNNNNNISTILDKGNNILVISGLFRYSTLNIIIIEPIISNNITEHILKFTNHNGNFLLSFVSSVWTLELKFIILSIPEYINIINISIVDTTKKINILFKINKNNIKNK